VTSITCPPRPPAVIAPKPSAPGKAGSAEERAVIISVVLTGEMAGGIVMADVETGKQPGRLVENSISRNNLTLNLLIISPPLF
jgi:hypothetical protein